MKVYLVVVDTLADWEIGYLTAELHSRRFFADPSQDCQLLKAGLNCDAVTSMGGVIHTPDMAIDDIQMSDNDLLLLPGAEIWQSGQARPALELAHKVLDEGRQVAAICGATIGLASIGALNARRHTSNDLGFLKTSCPDYRGEHMYRKEPAVRGDNLITASGLAPLEFSYEVLKMLKVWKPETAKAWYRLHKTRQERWYHELVASMSTTPTASS
ncbi:DJ-1/PfpI family protein [Massilia sp. HP4]|uniref:DJ-1/PfpI family protein n=1 Tax=Massilia sp. HP4 TaxID=2562316 RepID=UPI0010C14074|nr:DJ-1/PfpI family protein [Massilia sp. HP4]